MTQLLSITKRIKWLKVKVEVRVIMAMKIAVVTAAAVFAAVF